MPPQAPETRARRPRCEDGSRDGWAGKQNGELLALAVGQFEVFLTADRNLSYQQDVSSFDIAIVVLIARSNSFEDLQPLGPQILDVLTVAKRGAVTLVGA